MSRIAQWIEWLTKSRYTRSLEIECERLRGELNRWQNAMLETANLPSVHEREAKQLPVIKKRMTPSQWRAAAERATERPPEEKKPV